MLERSFVHVFPQPSEVVPLWEDLGQLIEDLPVATVQVGPRLRQAPQRRALHRGKNGEQLKRI